ncbi:MAG TPA: metallophosphoesterase family protein [Allosphingosinicella sp.]|nr:metallophosphoesterase family protein [Allosphingosinicella sp.]
MALYFTGDTHFGDHRTINIHKRPFASSADMDAALIEAWNETVGGDDVVWHLGDFSRRGAAAEGLLTRLNGIKHLVAGNNDPPATRSAAGWASVSDYAEFEIDDRRIVLCHYPFRSWNGQAKGALNLHGHSHGRMKPLPRQVDVGVDAWGFCPVSAAQILARLALQSG